MVLEPKDPALSLRVTLVATFAGVGPAAAHDPRLQLTIEVANTGPKPLGLQLAFPLLRGLQLGATNGSADLGIQHLETGGTGYPAWGGCAQGPTTDSW